MPSLVRRLVVVGVIALGTIAIPAEAATTLTPSLAPVLEKVLPGVVSVSVSGSVAVQQNPLYNDPFFRRFFGIPQGQQPPRQTFQAAGSGVIVDAAKGYILTNNHVVENADSITVTLRDGRNLDARKIGTDPATDLAVIQVQADNLSAVPFGDSGVLQVGDYVVAVGNPFGLGGTVTLGIVSALGRTGLGIEGYEDFIQTDASINPGNSGGALIDINGDLVGINAAIVGPSGGNVGIGFAIPINMARAVMDQLIAHGEIKRGMIGVVIQDLTPDLAAALNVSIDKGAVVSQTQPGSPAETAGIKDGDIVIALNGQPIDSASALRNAVGLLPVGTEVDVTVNRGGQSLDFKVTLAELKTPTLTVPADIRPLAGVTLGPIEPGSPLYGKLQGAVVADVDSASPAARAGLLAGDVIFGVDQHPVTSPQDVVDQARADPSAVLLQLVRNGQSLYLVIR